ncbi:hypothetical protein [Blastochloris sulfoviridis]|uniref:FeoB-associated Cys-rich membrane protein n=1 Tax=Blastochloris sulfoviridis TaxID=50712 RepID=A0A5M6I1U0_9HYPH|nr:hypothetical protein [Blastochloris sulfoviridis]KAA5602171.1 hypothetical protein F1193_07350 [Blastochloris sulfoviridis]
MTTTAAVAAPPVPAVDLSGEATAGPWEIIIPVVIAVAALLYLARSYGFLGKRKKPGCAQCASGSGSGCAGQAAAPEANTCAATSFAPVPGRAARRDE